MQSELFPIIFFLKGYSKLIPLRSAARTCYLLNSSHFFHCRSRSLCSLMAKTSRGIPKVQIGIFHGFQVPVLHVEYFEILYKKEGEFWKSCTLRSPNLVGCMLEALGKALRIAHTPWSDISQADLETMVRTINDVRSVGFKLDSLDYCVTRAKRVIHNEIGRSELERELEKLEGEIASLERQLEPKRVRATALKAKLKFFYAWKSTCARPIDD